MFLGHFAVALAGKKAAPRASLGTLVVAAQFLDLLWPALLLAGVEHVRIDPGNTRMTPLDFYDYPISHSLVMVCLWGAAFGLVYFLARRNGRASLVLGLLVASHWVLDLIVHRPDLPLTPGSTRYLKLGLWNSMPGTLAVETGLFLAGIVVYLKATRSLRWSGTIGFWVFALVLYAIYLANVFGPPPPSAAMIAWVGMGQWLIVLWAWWVDRQRTPAQTPEPAKVIPIA